MLGSGDFGLRVDFGLVYSDIIGFGLSSDSGYFFVRAQSIWAGSVSDIIFSLFFRVSVGFGADWSGRFSRIGSDIASSNVWGEIIGVS